MLYSLFMSMVYRQRILVRTACLRSYAILVLLVGSDVYMWRQFDYALVSVHYDRSGLQEAYCFDVSSRS